LTRIRNPELVTEQYTLWAFEWENRRTRSKHINAKKGLIP